MRWQIFLIALLIVSCAPDAALDPDLHGREPAKEPNVPAQPTDVQVVTEEVNYYADVTGYLARPNDDLQHPGVVMIHEWWGLNDNIKAMARELAAQGYVVLAVDLYHGRVATTSDAARQYMTSFDQIDGLMNMQAAVRYLREQNTGKIASLGWCFGGGQSLQIGLVEDLDATVIYYGSLVTDEEELSQIEQPVLGIFAGLDAGIPPSEVEKFKASLDAVGVENDITIYPNVNHAFANPSGDRYAPAEAEDAWQKTTAFLREKLQ